MEKKILIVGGGIGGLCAALSLTKQGFLVSVFEQSKSLGEVGAGLQMTPNAMKVLTALGLLEQIKKVSFSPENAVIRHYQTGRKFLNVPLGGACSSRYNSPYLHLHRADLHRILLDEAKVQGVIFHLNSKVVHFEQDDRQVSITMESGETFSGSMLIGADGIRSTVLEQLQKSLSFQCNHKSPIFTGQVAWRGTIATDRLPKGLIKPDATVWAGPGRHFVTYYLRGGKMINFVAVEERSQWTEESWTTPGEVQQLKHSFAGWNSEVTQLLGAVENTFLWGLFSREPLPKWHLNRVALLGDACHPMLPFMAQGAAMAIEDGFVLAKELSGVALENSQDVEQVFTRYTHQRLPRTSKVQAMSKANAELYHMKGGAIGRIRLNAMGVVTSALPSVVNVKLDPVYGLDVTQ